MPLEKDCGECVCTRACKKREIIQNIWSQIYITFFKRLNQREGTMAGICRHWGGQYAIKGATGRDYISIRDVSWSHSNHFAKVEVYFYNVKGKTIFFLWCLSFATHTERFTSDIVVTKCMRTFPPSNASETTLGCPTIQFNSDGNLN